MIFENKIHNFESLFTFVIIFGSNYGDHFVINFLMSVIVSNYTKNILNCCIDAASL